MKFIVDADLPRRIAVHLRRFGHDAVPSSLWISPIRTGPAEAIDRERLAKQLATPEGIDRMESFGTKFSRLQDTLSDKVLPLFLRVARRASRDGGRERPSRRAPRHHPRHPGMVEASGLHNRLVHEYIDDLAALPASLDVGRRFTTVLIEAVHAKARHTPP